MSYNLNKFDFNSYQKNWINTAQNHSHRTSPEGEAFMKGVFFFIIAGVVICALI